MELPVRKTHSTKGLLCSLFLLAAPVLSQATPIISEIMADNESGLRDQDGDWEDWLEIYNPDPDPVGSCFGSVPRWWRCLGSATAFAQLCEWRVSRHSEPAGRAD